MTDLAEVVGGAIALNLLFGLPLWLGGVIVGAVSLLLMPMRGRGRRRFEVLMAAGLHVVLPEYNGSYPGVLKYFIDMLKFPESFENKPAAFVGVANGQWGALRAVEQQSKKLDVLLTAAGSSLRTSA